MNRLFCIFLILIGLQACTTTDKKSVLLEGTEGQLVSGALQRIENENFLDAVEELEAIEVRFPFGQYSEIVKLNLIYAGQFTEDYPLVINKANSYIKHFKQSEHLDYVLYMRGVAQFMQDYSINRRYLTSKDYDQDLSSLESAYRDFDGLVQLYPDSEYVPDAKARMVYIRNALADRHLESGLFYLERGAYAATLKQADTVLNDYPNTPATQDALALKVKAYEQMGMDSHKNEYYQLLKANFPDYENLTDDSVALKTPSESVDWLALITFGLL